MPSTDAISTATRSSRLSTANGFPQCRELSRAASIGDVSIESYLREIGELWESFRAIYDEWHDLGDRVLALGRYEARGRGSGVPVEAQLGGIWDLRDHKISRVRNYLDHREALRAAGLSE
jgi:ketosteroid isomerase-like protein